MPLYVYAMGYDPYTLMREPTSTDHVAEVHNIPTQLQGKVHKAHDARADAKHKDPVRSAPRCL